MKKHHLIALIVVILFAAALLFWPQSHTPDSEISAPELIGTWYAGGANAEGFEWFMEYEFEIDGSYQLTTGTDYEEKGTYQIGTRYLDGSMEVEKTFDEGNKTHTMIILTTDDPDVLKLEGVDLQRVTE